MHHKARLLSCGLKTWFFVRAEREADWPLHLWAVKEMPPYFFAAGHCNYARYDTYYLHSMEKLSKKCSDAS